MKLGPVLVSLRPEQWTKNLVLFAALAFSKHLFEAPMPPRQRRPDLSIPESLEEVIVKALEKDRGRRFESMASFVQALETVDEAPAAAVGLAAVIGVLSLAISFFLGPRFAACAALYLALNLLYSFYLKEVVILDVLAISLGFVLRAVAGAMAIEVLISEWLLICTILLALFLTLSKRRHELTSLTDLAVDHRPTLQEYSPYLLDQMIAVVTPSCVMAYALYTLAQETRDKFQTDRLAWTIPFVLYGIFRYLYLVHRKEKGGSPTDMLLTDRPLLIDVFLWALAVVLIIYTARGLPMPLGR